MLEKNPGSMFGLLRKVLLVVGALAGLYVLFNGMFFYAEPGFIYHVRTITGEEKVVDDVGYAMKNFGKVTEWKKALTIQSVINHEELSRSDDDLSTMTSATISAFSVVFLDQVDAKIESTARFRLPTGHESFLKLAREYRSPENFMKTALIPAMKDTLQSTASLMSADEYYSGGRAEFSTNFENQLTDGIFLVKRRETRSATQAAPQTAIAQKGTDQGAYGQTEKTVYVVEKVLDPNTNQPIRKSQKFREYGVDLVEARMTNIVPNAKFIERMAKKQESAAELSIAKQERLKEEERRQLVITKGETDREAQRQASLKEQAQKTTEAETAKQLALIEASKQKEQAELQKQTSEILLLKAEIDAKSTRVTADAEAYAKKAAIDADNGLKQKLEAWVSINQQWASAFAQRQVPKTVFANSSESKSVTGSDNELTYFMQILAAKAAQDLDADVRVKRGTDTTNP
jgi:regulator of protease activity HflC (stomatin/prohibitin superfamily)